ncbi:MAG: TldD/PmbA family protein [Rickettsiales bacterium]|nr:TldD/PmbA family protein [Rickettsiales bacterium]
MPNSKYPATATPQTQPAAESITMEALDYARAAGATQADVVLIDSLSKSFACRLGKQESLERSAATGIGLRVWFGQKQAIVSTSDFATIQLKEMAERAVAMAKASTDDPYSALAPEEMLANDWPNLDLYDGTEPTAEEMQEKVLAAEAAAMEVTGISNSEGADAYYGTYRMTLATSAGFMAHQEASSASLAVSVLAGEGDHMERDYDYASGRYWSALTDPETLGRQAAAYTLRRLHPRRVATTKVPLVFDPRVGRSLLGTLAGAISGAAVARGTSFLKHKMGEPLFPEHIRIIDDPHRLQGLSSRPFDGEGVRTQRQVIVENGRLQTWLLDTRSARQLGLTTTGHASRGLASNPSPSPSNFYLEAGTISPKAMIKDIKQGLYVTEVFGMGVNTVTGDYSQGAAGLWIENGELTYPVSEITIAGHLLEMFQHITPANDLVFRYGVNVPTLRVDGMTLAGD